MIPVLFVDDNRELCTLYRSLLSEAGPFSVHTCTSGAEALAWLEDHAPVVVISDYDMPEMNGIDLLVRARERDPRLSFIILTGDGRRETVIDALNAGAEFFLEKGDDLAVQVLDLSRKVQILAGRREAEENASRREKILAAISYAAERLLAGSGWQEDMEEILGYLGRATGADCVYLVRTVPDDTLARPMGPVIWKRSPAYPDPCLCTPQGRTWLHEQEKAALLSANQEVVVRNDELPMGRGGMSLLIPVFLADQWWGILGIGDRSERRVFAAEEIHALRMAAGVIGSARYRMYIEEFFRNPVEESLVGIFLLRGKRFGYVNPRFCEIFGYPRDFLMHGVYPENLIHPENRSDVIVVFREVVEGRVESGHYEIAGLTAEGRKIFLEVFLRTIWCDGAACLVGNLMDVTDRYYSRKALCESEEKFRELYTGIQDMVFIHLLPGAEGGRIADVNQAVTETLLYTQEELSSCSLPDLCPDPRDRERIEDHCVVAGQTGRAGCQGVLGRSDGFPIPVDLSTHRVMVQGRPVLLTVARNDTERTLSDAKARTGEELLKRSMLISLQEKDTLLREIHHRVKNNLQIIISLLKLQEGAADNPAVHGIIRDCRNRVYTMAIIHEKLYQTVDLHTIRLAEYFREIAGSVLLEFEQSHNRIHLEVAEQSRVSADIGTAIPLGLILNELVTNSMKYAFTPDEEGNILIDIREEAGILTVRVCDSGRGLPEGFDGETCTTLGTSLVRGLTAQLRGSVVWTGGAGTCCTVTVPHRR